MSNYEIYNELNINKDENETVRELMVEELNKVDTLKSLYSENFIFFIKKLIIKNSLNFEYIINKLPSAKLIEEDEKIYFTIKKIYGRENGLPISYVMVDKVIKTGNVDGLTDMCYMTSEEFIKPPFTKDEFINSLPMVKQKEKKYVYNF